uniref:Uncharacterized protein n=1 Tax=Oryza glumipatula TaxID=40148 RepID=A0A0D9Z7P6_9ORYZ
MWLPCQRARPALAPAVRRGVNHGDGAATVEAYSAGRPPSPTCSAQAPRWAGRLLNDIACYKTGKKNKKDVESLV